MSTPVDAPAPHLVADGRPQWRSRLLAAVLAIVCFGGAVLDWVLLVTTHTGQVMEQSALTGSLIGSRFVSDHASNLLHVITMPALIVLLLVILIGALWRGSRRRALWAAGTVIATTGSVQVLKRWVFTRPDYGLSWRFDGANTLPSGHTAVAASAAVALVLVAGARWRGGAAWFGAVLTAAIGYSTLAAQWHRPADVLAAILIAVGWGALAVACGAWSEEKVLVREDHRLRWIHDAAGGDGTTAAVLGPETEDPAPRRRRPRRDEGPTREPSDGGLTSVGVLGGLGAFAGAVAAFLELWTYLSASTSGSRLDDFLAYAAGSAGTVALSFIGLALLTALSPDRRRRSTDA